MRKILTNKNQRNKKGFTLIELLVVISIIGLLSSVVLASLTTARTKSRDVRRLSDTKQIQLALELYYDTNGHYPQRDFARTDESGGNPNWVGLRNDLAPYINLPSDPQGDKVPFRYHYDADSRDEYKTYGFMVRFEDPSNFSKANEDGGYYGSGYYEVGPQPVYCRNKYAGTDGNWLSGGSNKVCRGGN